MKCDIKNSEVLSILDIENWSWYNTWQSAHDSFCRKLLQSNSIQKLKI